jgi:signal transduction histidine kinase
MRLPAFLSVLRAQRHRPVLLTGVTSGYAAALALLILAALAQAWGVMSWSWGFYLLVLLKLMTTSLAWLGILRRRFEVEASALNILASFLLFTAAIHLTGGPPSPLVALYVIEVAVLAVLANAAVATLGAAAALGLYVGLLAGGALGFIAPPEAWAGDSARGADVGRIVGEVAIVALLLAATVAFASAARRRLRARERVLEARANELVEANKLKALFTANVTHELRTPIHGILGLTELLEEEVYGAIADKQRGALEGIRYSAEGLLKQIDDLLEIARAESGRMELSVSRFPLADVIERVVSTAAWMKGGKPLEIASEIPRDLPMLESDRGKLVQILVNLVSNAIKFTPDGGRVRIEARALEAERVLLAVEDTGVGIPSSERERIFEAFRQAEARGAHKDGAARDYGGVGLGLSLVKRLAELLGGQVRVDSTVGRGSRFEVELPLRPLR